MPNFISIGPAVWPVHIDVTKNQEPWSYKNLNIQHLRFASMRYNNNKNFCQGALARYRIEVVDLPQAPQVGVAGS